MKDIWWRRVWAIVTERERDREGFGEEFFFIQCMSTKEYS